MNGTGNVLDRVLALLFPREHFMNTLLGRPLQFGDTEQIAALKKLEKEVDAQEKKFMVNVRYVEIVELKKTSIFEIYAKNSDAAESEVVEKIRKRYEKQKSIDIDFIDIRVTEVKEDLQKDTKTLNMFKNGKKKYNSIDC